MDKSDQSLSTAALLRKANKLFASGRLGPAFHVARSAINGAPTDARGYILAAEILEANLRYRAALDYVIHGLLVAPDHQKLGSMKAKLLKLTGDIMSSVMAYESLIERFPAATAFIDELGLALIASGQIERGITLLERARSAEGEGFRIVARKGLVAAYTHGCDFASARRIYEEIHLDTHMQTVAALANTEIGARLETAKSADLGLVENHGAALRSIASTRKSTPLLRSFLRAAGDVTGLSAERSYYFPNGRSLSDPEARLDVVLASQRSTRSDHFIDASSQMLGLTYRTTNLGDDIQTLAALNLTGKVKAFVDRDRLDEPGPAGKIVLNGWWGHHRSFPIATRDLSVAWPPRTELRSLIVSLHLDPVRASLYLTPEGIAYLKEHEPIGCRDRWTEGLLQRCGIKAYFSGCLTLTLPLYEGQRTDRILLVDLPGNALSHIRRGISQHCNFKQRTMTHEIVRFTTDPVRRLNAADFILRCYARSKLVVTSRLHVALPCLAMGTPVLFLPRDVADRRFEGLSDFLNMVPLAEAIDDPKLLDPARWPRRTDHLSMRNALIDAVRGFTTRQLV